MKRKDGWKIRLCCVHSCRDETTEKLKRSEILLLRKQRNESFSLWMDMVYRLSLANHVYTPLYTKNRLVDLATEWLPWLHDTSEASCREVVSLSFPPLFLIPEWETAKKLVVLYSSLYYHSKPCNHGNHSAVETTEHLFSQWYSYCLSLPQHNLL